MASDRYQAGGSQAERQPGSNGQVLRNKADITDPTQMDEAELALLLQLYELVLREQLPERRLDVADIMEWHRLWLGNLYDWAGQELGWTGAQRQLEQRRFSLCRSDTAAGMPTRPRTSRRFNAAWG